MEASVTIVALLLMAAGTLFWVWALVDVVRHPQWVYRGGSQTLWVLVIALTHFIGAVVYVLFGRPRAAGRAATAGR